MFLFFFLAPEITLSTLHLLFLLFKVFSFVICFLDEWNGQGDAIWYHLFLSIRRSRDFVSLVSEFEPGLSAFTSEICFEFFLFSIIFMVVLSLLPSIVSSSSSLLLNDFSTSFRLSTSLLAFALDDDDIGQGRSIHPCMLDMLESLSRCRIRQQGLSITSMSLQHHHSSSDIQISTANWHGYDHTAI